MQRSFRRLGCEFEYQCFRRAFRDDLAVVHDGDAIAELFGLFHVMGGQYNGHATLIQALHQIPQISLGLRV